MIPLKRVAPSSAPSSVSTQTPLRTRLSAAWRVWLANPTLLPDPTPAHQGTAPGATTRVRPQNFQNPYDANLAYDFNSAKFLVLSENQLITALHQIVARSNRTMAAIFTTAPAQKPGFLRPQFGKKYDHKKVRNSYTNANIVDAQGREIKKFSGSSSHMENFLTAVRSRKTTDLHADILEGHLSSALCHTANISYRLGHSQSPEAIQDAVKSDRDLTEMLGRMETHLGANKVDLSKTPATLGVVLKMDPKTERFIDNAAANQMLTRDYRAPFIVPEKV